MITQPAFKPIFHIETTGDEALFLFSESEPIILQGRAYALLAPLIDGQKTVDELVDLLHPQLPLTEVYYSLMHMEKKGLFIQSDTSLPPQVAAFWSSLNVEAATVVRRLAETTVTVTAVGAVDASSLIDNLQGLSVSVGAAGDLDIVLTDDYLREDLHEINQRALTSGRPWLLAKPVGTSVWLGPVFRPQVTGCWECLAQRLRLHRNSELFLQQQKARSQPIIGSRALLPSTLHTALDLVATETAKALVLADRHALNGSLVSLDLLTLQSQTHTLVHRPQCPACGSLNGRSQHPSPIALQSHTKQEHTQGGDRVVTAEETLRTYSHHVSPITGILGKLERVATSGANDPIHNYVAGLNHAVKQQDSLQHLRHHLRTNSGGKGRNDLQAKAGALCEAIERYSIRFQGDEYRIEASFAELGNRAIHPNQCMLFSPQQFDNRVQINQHNQLPGRQIPLPFDDKQVMEWTPVWSLTEEMYKYLPTSYCYFGYPQQPDEFFCKADSNGCAAGNTLEEAILQGFMELVERDSVGMWWYNRIPRGGVDLDSFGLPYLAQLQDYYRSLNRELWVLDVTNDLEVPSFVAVSRAQDGSSERILCGFGAHLNPETALLRAVTEMNQFLPTLLQWELYEYSDSITTEWWKTATLANQSYLKPDPDIPVKKASDFSYTQHEDILDDVRRCQRLVEQKGLEMLVLDQTRPDIGLSVVKVIVPGLRHFWNRYAPGRLYDVPVQMGWLPKPRQEAELNPIPIFF